MKDGIKLANICLIILSLISVALAVVTAIFGFYQWYIIVLLELVFVLGVCLVRFPYQFACIRNAWHSISYKNRENDFEPSELAIKCAKACGYIFMFATTVAYLVAAILY